MAEHLGSHTCETGEPLAVWWVQRQCTRAPLSALLRAVGAAPPIYRCVYTNTSEIFPIGASKGARASNQLFLGSGWRNRERGGTFDERQPWVTGGMSFFIFRSKRPPTTTRDVPSGPRSAVGAPVTGTVLCGRCESTTPTAEHCTMQQRPAECPAARSRLMRPRRLHHARAAARARRSLRSHAATGP